jgi:ligand-binding sensor domain-containing protein
VGVLNAQVNDIALDRDENLWVATSSGLNRISREDDNDIAAFSTFAEFRRSLSQLRYPFDVITPIVHENCLSLVVHPSEDLLYIGTLAGISVYDFSPAPATESDLSQVYVFPNPLYGRKGHNELKIGNITGPVTIDVYTMEGDLVHSQSVSQANDVIWDLTTSAGFVAASGTYLVRIRTESSSIVKTVAIIR